MSELLDAFDDAGLDDDETRAFLVEALSHAEASEWADILEPFVSPIDGALAALRNVPGVLERSRRAFEAAAAAKAEDEKLDVIAEYFLKALPLPGGILFFSGVHAVAAVARVCRAARLASSTEVLWQSRLEQLRSRWSLSPPELLAAAATAASAELRGAALREHYLAVLRPRCDGLYVGECRFKRWVPIGHNFDMRKNAEQLAMKFGRGSSDEWVHYRRYVRLLPPDAIDGTQWAFVLQDPSSREVVEKALVAGVDPLSHANPAKSEGVLTENNIHSNDIDRIQQKICVGTYMFTPSGTVEVRYRASEGNFHLTFSLSHGGPRACSDRLQWEHYTMEDESSEVIAFNLGRLEDWRGGGLTDENKDHFPQLQFRPKRVLEHLL